MIPKASVYLRGFTDLNESQILELAKVLPGVMDIDARDKEKLLFQGAISKLYALYVFSLSCSIWAPKYRVVFFRSQASF